MNDTSKTDRSPWRVFLIFLRLGLTSFGRPVAHLAYFRDEFVTKRAWLTEQSYADLLALCQFLPGPASSQVGMALGLSRCGHLGALAAWAGFTLPSALLLTWFALSIANWGELMPGGVLHGLKIAAVAVVMQAAWGMARHLCRGPTRLAIMAASACGALAVPYPWMQAAVIALAAVIGMLSLTPETRSVHEPLPRVVPRLVGVFWLMLFVVMLIGLPLAADLLANHTLSVVAAFYRAGALVFGGGHVVLPLLQADVVTASWVSQDAFMAGYGAAQAVPGPLFTFAAFLGASMKSMPNGWLGAWICLMAIFTPSFLLVAGIWPFWDRLRRNTRMQAAMYGVNAAVVGLLLATLYHPVGTSAIHSAKDMGLAALCLAGLMHWQLPPWLVVAVSVLLSWLMGNLP